jgi:hypothetical protein
MPTSAKFRQFFPLQADENLPLAGRVMKYIFCLLDVPQKGMCNQFYLTSVLGATVSFWYGRNQLPQCLPQSVFPDIYREKRAYFSEK